VNSLERLITALAKLPGLGRKSAARLAYHLLRADPSYVRALAADLVALRERIRPCRICGAYTETEHCQVCTDPTRDPVNVCVVEQPQDVETIEATGEFRGRYHVLMGVLSPLDGVGPEDLRIDRLLQRVREEGVREVIVATNPTVEGEATALLLAKQLKGLGVVTSQLAHGLPVGSDLEYSDRLTVSRALRGRVRLD
jgi:recombination protein RecR